MPTYEYRCPAGHEFELFQKISNRPRAKCPSCGRLATRQISGGAGLVFKGSGFYITDYGKDGKGARTESEKSDGAEKSDKPAPEQTKAETPAEPTGESRPAKGSKKAPKKEPT